MPRPSKKKKENTELLNPIDRFFEESGTHMAERYGSECVSSALEEDKNLLFIEVPDLAFQWALGRQGFALGRILQIMGFEGASKTSFALWLTELFYKAGGFGAYIETEFAGSSEHMKYYLTNPGRLRIFHPETIEDALEMTIEALDIFAKIDPESIIPKIIVLDSIAGASDARAQENPGENVIKSRVGGSSKVIKDATNYIKNQLRQTNTLWAVLNQGRDKIDTSNGFGGMIPEMDKIIGSGGRAIPFAATYWMILKKMAMTKDADEKSGFKAKCSFKKNKLRVPYREVNYAVKWNDTLQMMEQTLAMLAASDILGMGAKKGGLYFCEDIGITDADPLSMVEMYNHIHSPEIKPLFQVELDIITTDRLLKYTPPAVPVKQENDRTLEPVPQVGAEEESAEAAVAA